MSDINWTKHFADACNSSRCNFSELDHMLEQMSHYNNSLCSSYMLNVRGHRLIDWCIPDILMVDLTFDPSLKNYRIVYVSNPNWYKMEAVKMHVPDI